MLVTCHWSRFPNCVQRKRGRVATNPMPMTAVKCRYKIPDNLLLPILLYTYCKADAVMTSCLIIHVLPLISRFISPAYFRLDVQYQQVILAYHIIHGEHCAPWKDKSCILSGFPGEVIFRWLTADEFHSISSNQACDIEKKSIYL